MQVPVFLDAVTDVANEPELADSWVPAEVRLSIGGKWYHVSSFEVGQDGKVPCLIIVGSENSGL